MLGIQKSALNHLLNGKVLKRISDSRMYGNEYTLPEMLNDLTISIFFIDSKTQVSPFRQNLQREYVDRLIVIAGLQKKSNSDHLSQAASMHQLKDILKLVSKRSKTNDETTIHREFLAYKISAAFDSNN